ncbi:pseudouridine synthase [Arcanobacterium hippocoleae]|uniref:RNA pseudouridylate synthase n=1 Tax=Arcanobacterium hippocoleae TaxID=149017 RepID=A0ABU1T3Y4_9ACTO|nr:pseudouridine synthase [Arcanobacterium hippocoleae]MDR6940112.1 tRNA pseudouridine32 synthase/23S rRNA pseudouridine746 synthase [Arcanobacterium hippocoleae]
MHRKRSERRAAKRAMRANLAPPLRGGINASEIVLPQTDSQGNPVAFETLGQWADAGWGDDALAAFARGDYLADGNVLLSADTPYRAGQRIWVFRPVLDEPEKPIELAVVAENERYLVVEKPHGMATIPRGSHVANTVTVAARRQFQNDLLVAAHRLDLETAGLVLLTKAPEFRAKYQTVFQRREIQKKYFAAAPICAEYADGAVHSLELPLYRPAGQISVDVFAADSPCGQAHLEKGGRVWGSQTEIRLVREVRKAKWLGSKLSAVGGDLKSQLEIGADSEFTCGARRDPNTQSGRGKMTEINSAQREAHPDFVALPEKWGIYELRPHTGYLHQLRAVMLHLGAPIFGDPLYPVWFTKEREAARAFYLQLLAAELEFIDPDDGELLRFVSNQRLWLDVQ